jgi:UDP-glucuronate decarboxylase
MNKIEEQINILSKNNFTTVELPFSTEKKIKALITGASGIIGLAIFRFLQSTCIYNHGNLEIHCVCKEPKDFHKIYFSGDQIKLIKTNLPERTYEDFSDKYDLIFNCAGYGQPGKFLDDYEAIYTINTLNIIDLLGKLTHDGYFLNIGTSEVYSENNYELTKESSLISINNNNIRNTYILAKLAAESIILRHALNNHGSRVLSARVALAYGPGAQQNDTRVMYQLFRQAYKNNHIKLLDDGSAIRTYIYVNDCVEIMLKSLFDRKKKLNIINISGDEQLTILDLANKIGNLYNIKVSKGAVGGGIKNAPKEVRVNTEFSKYYRNEKLISIDEGLLSVKDWVDVNLKE